jgi:hypothetical protein
MVKYLAMAAALVAVLATADLAQARHRRGCSSCSAGGGCPGGVCSVPGSYAPQKMAATDNAPPALAATPAPAPVAAAAQPAQQTYVNNTGRRGLFGWRR